MMVTIFPTNFAISDHQLAFWALALTIVNAIVAILQYLRTVMRRAKVRSIRMMYRTSIHDIQAGRPGGDAILEVDVLSTGATIWDMSVHIEAFIPAIFEEGKPPQNGTQWSQNLSPAKEINSLNSGQAMKFILKKSDLTRQKLGPDLDAYRYSCEEISRAPLRYISLAVYCANRRQLLKRVRSRKLHWAVQNFFKASLNAKPPFKASLYVTFLELSRRKRFDDLRRWIEKRRPGSFDMFCIRLTRLLSDEEIDD